MIFDCDGVILNSNQIKSKAFYDTVLPYGEKNAKEFLRYHKSNGGISRYKKFRYYLEEIAPELNINLNDLIQKYSKIILNDLMKSEICDSIDLLREEFYESKWFIITGGDEREVRNIFDQRDLTDYFDGGIYGSPKSKDIIFKELLDKEIIKLPAIYLGDSKKDYTVSQKFSVDFLFVYGWTEVDDWEDFCLDSKINFIEKPSDLLR